MPLSRAEFDSLRAQGLSVQDIIAREHGGVPTAPPAPPVVDPASLGTPEGNTMAGALGATGEALSGLRGVGLGVGGIGGALVLRRMLRGRGGATQQPAPEVRGGPPQGPVGEPPVAPPAEVAPHKLPASLSKGIILTEQDIAEHPEFKRFRPGYEMDRATYQKTLMGTGPGSAAGRGRATKAVAGSKVAGNIAPSVSTTTAVEQPGLTQGFSAVEQRGANHGFAQAPADVTALPGAPVQEVADLSKVPKWLGGTMSEAKARHDLPYFSESTLKRTGVGNTAIEDMTQPHLNAAIQRLSTNPKIGEKGLQNLRDMKVELEYRSGHAQGGVNVLPRNEPGTLKARRAEAAQIAADVEQMTPGSTAARVKAIVAKAAKSPGGKAAGKALKFLGEADRALGAAGFILPKETIDDMFKRLESLYGNHSQSGPKGA